MVRLSWLSMMLFGAMLAGPALGHARLVNSAPASGARVAEAPKVLSLSFSEAVKLASLTLTSAGKAISVTLDKSAPSSKSLLIPLERLEPGSYEFHWTAISTDDGHVTKGSFAFTISGAATAQ